MLLTEDNFKILQPIVYTSRIFGLCPVAFKKIGNYYQIKYSPLLVFYSYAVLLVSGVGIILGVRRDIEAGSNAVRMKSIRTRYITLCDIAMVFMIALYGVMSTPYRMKRFVRMLDIWSGIDKMIPISDFHKYRKCSIIFVTGTVLATTGLSLFDMFIYCLQWRVSNGPTFYLQTYISYYVLYFMLALQEIYFWHLVFFIHIRIVSLNERLSIERGDFKNSCKILFVVQHALKSENNSTRDRARLRENGSVSNEAIKFGKNTGERLQELMRIYGKIKETVEILNDSSSYGIVLLMLSCLVHLVVTPYFLLVEIFRKSPSIAFMALQAIWFLAHVGRLLIIVEPCQRCLKESKITSNLVSEMALLDFDKDTKKMLKSFASQISYSTISFNASGFFNINRNLLTSVAGAVTTYLVILFQFNGNDES